MHEPAWWTWWSVWGFGKFMLPVVISALALAFVLYDRRSRLLLKTRAGIWSMLRDVRTVRGQELVFQGIIEIYNLSSRPNAIRGYEVHSKVPDGKWVEMKTEYSELDSGDGKGPQIFNQSPRTLAPFSGIEARVMGIGDIQKAKQMIIRVGVEDLFGKHYEIEMTTYS